MADEQATEAHGIVAALLAVSQAVGVVPKGKKMEDGPARYAYRSIEQITPLVHGAFIECGVVCAPEVIESQHTSGHGKNQNMRQAIMRVRYRFTALDGSHIDAVVQGEALDTSDKASNKALTAAWKQALVQTLCIPLEDADDPDHDSPQHGTAKKAPAKRAADKPSDDVPDGMISTKDAKRELVTAYIATGLDDDEAKAAESAAWKAAHIAAGPIPQEKLRAMVQSALVPVTRTDSEPETVQYAPGEEPFL